MKRIHLICSIVVAVIVIFGAGFGAISYFAKATELQCLSNRVTYGFLEARANDLQKRMWEIEKQFGYDKNKWLVHVRSDYEKYKAERDVILKKLEIIFAAQQKKGKE